MRGVSAIVELLLITLLLIALVSLLWLFTSGTIRAITQSGTNQTQRTQEIFSTCMIVDSVHGSTIYLKNCGYGVITNSSLNVYLDDIPLRFNVMPQTISKGGVGTININALSMVGISIGDHVLKITNPNAQTVQTVEAVLPSSCVMDLEFDEGSGTTAHDSSGNGSDGTLVNGPSWVSGIHGGALQFDGVNDYVATVNTLTLTPPLTISVWFNNKTTSSINTLVADSGSGAPTLGFRFFVNKYPSLDGRLFMEMGDGTSNNNLQSAAGLVTSGGWHNALAVINGIGINSSLYFDGTNVDNETLTITFSKTGVVNVGRMTSNEFYFNGTIDSVRIFNQALTPDQTIILKMK